MKPFLPPFNRAPRGARVRVGSFEYQKTGVRRFDLSDPYGWALGLSWGAFAAMFAVLELAINAVFGGLYWLQPGSVANMPVDSFLYAFFFSVETLATVGYGVMAPATLYGHIVSSIEILSGIAFTAIMTGLTFVRFSRPKPRIIYADRAVVARHNGVPTLMLRLASAGSGIMTDASARLSVLLAEHTLEGQTIRRTYELKLIRDRSPVFVLAWTLMHPITESSPLYGLDRDQMQAERLRLFLSFEAWDASLAAKISDFRDYSATAIVFGARYADTVTIDDQGRPTADLSRISSMEADTLGPEGSAGEPPTAGAH